jgi:hypothetical protein
MRRSAEGAAPRLNRASASDNKNIRAFILRLVAHHRDAEITEGSLSPLL